MSDKAGLVCGSTTSTLSQSKSYLLLGGFTPGFRTKNPSLFVFLAKYYFVLFRKYSIYSNGIYRFSLHLSPITSIKRQPQTPPPSRLRSKLPGAFFDPGGTITQTMHSPDRLLPCAAGVRPSSSLSVNGAPSGAESQLPSTSNSNHTPQHQRRTPPSSLGTPTPPHRNLKDGERHQRSAVHQASCWDRALYVLSTQRLHHFILFVFLTLI